ncbi:MAG: hypothetical protein ACI3VN_09990 [Candidatus Onthomonas sp.]
MKGLAFLLGVFSIVQAVIGFFRPELAFGAELMQTLEIWESKRRFLIHNAVNALVFGGFMISLLFTPDAFINENLIFYLFALAAMVFSFAACNFYNTGSFTRPPRRKEKR